MEDCPHLMYNEGIIEDVRNSSKQIIGKRYYTKMRSSLMAIMINEVTSFCSVNIKSSKQLKEQVKIRDYQGSTDSSFQLIYNYKSGGTTFEFITSRLKDISKEEKQRLFNIGVTLPTLMLVQPCQCDMYMSTIYIYMYTHT